MAEHEKIPSKPGIYKLTNKLNNKIYIGESINLHSRINNHKNPKNNRVISHAIRLYGWDNFEVELLEIFDSIDIDELLALETAYIVYYESLTIHGKGYNVCLFGNNRTGVKATEETREKLRQANLGKKLSEAHMGKEISKETRLKFSKINKERKSHIPMKRGKEDFKGSNNPRFDSKIYIFINIKTNEQFTGTRFDFYTKYNLSASYISNLVTGRILSYIKWIVLFPI